jgi:hypothetical protein
VKKNIWLLLILALYFAIATLFALYTPAWQSPDEPAHYNYISQVAINGCCPVIQVGDWDSDYLEQLKSSRFHPSLLGNLPQVQYEDHQPPLYYLLAAPLFNLTRGTLPPLRLLSVLIGSLVVMCAYLIGQALLPNRPWIAVGTAAFAAFLPQNVHILASVNNDALAWAIIALTLLVTILYLKGQTQWQIPKVTLAIPLPWLLGLLVGLGLLTKATTYFLVAVVLLAIFCHWRQQYAPAKMSFRQEAVKPWLRHGLQFLIPALFLGSLWWLRNVRVYGLPDFLGLQAHDRVVIGQLRTADYITQAGWTDYLTGLVQTTFISFWGQFGWMALPLSGRPLLVVAGLAAAAVSGWLIELVIKRNDRENGKSDRRPIIWVLGLTFMLTIAAYIGYNLEFLQFQGRYLYAGLIPIALFLVSGLEAWGTFLACLTATAHYRPYFCWLAISPLLLLPLLDIYILLRIIIPGLTP